MERVPPTPINLFLLFELYTVSHTSKAAVLFSSTRQRTPKKYINQFAVQTLLSNHTGYQSQHSLIMWCPHNKVLGHQDMSSTLSTKTFYVSVCWQQTLQLCIGLLNSERYNYNSNRSLQQHTYLYLEDPDPVVAVAVLWQPFQISLSSIDHSYFPG